MPHYTKPDFMTRNVFNPMMGFFTGRLGISLRGSAMLAVRGRTTSEWRVTPVNPLALDGQRYLVAPRGDTHWVRNLRASGAGELRRGRKTEPIRVAEVADAEKPAILRAYLARWRAETGKFFGVPKDPSDADLARVAPEHPVFRILP